MSHYVPTPPPWNPSTDELLWWVQAELQRVGGAFAVAEAEGGGSGVTDHGALTGLADDDHPQYHNDARGDARYSLLGHTHAFSDHGALSGLGDDDHTQYHTDARGDARYSLLGHTHSYLPLTGGTLTGDLTIQKTGSVGRIIAESTDFGATIEAKAALGANAAHTYYEGNVLRATTQWWSATGQFRMGLYDGSGLNIKMSWTAIYGGATDLYYDGSNKLSTDLRGVTVTGVATDSLDAANITTAPGNAVTVADGVSAFISTATATLAAGTITMPANPKNNQPLDLMFAGQITALTLSPNTGQSIIGALTSVPAGGHARYRYRAANTTWYRCGVRSAIATDRLVGRDTAGTGDAEELTVGGGIEFTGSGGIQTSAFTGDVTKTAGGTAQTIANNAVTYAKMQDVSATQRVLGRNTAGSGDPEEVTLSQLLDWIGSAAQGDILYRGASSWARLGAGTAGQVLQSGGAGANPSWTTLSGSNPWTLVKKSTDENRNTNTTLTVDTDLKVALAATTKYLIRCTAYFQTANATMDFKYDTNYTGTTTGTITYHRRHMAAGAAAGTDNENVLNGTGLIGSTSVAATTSGIGRVEIEMVIETNTAGDWQFRWAQDTSNASNLTCLRGGTIEVLTL